MFDLAFAPHWIEVAFFLPDLQVCCSKTVTAEHC